MLNLEGRRVVVIGAGRVGRRKAAAAVKAGADVVLVDPQGQEVQGARTVAASYDVSLLEGAFVVFACTDDRGLNAAIAADARRLGALVNAADQPEDCDFHLPAVIEQGPVTVAIGTCGCAPSLAVELKNRLAAALPPDLPEIAQTLEGIRNQLRLKVSDAHERTRIMRALAKNASVEALKERLKQLLSE